MRLIAFALAGMCSIVFYAETRAREPQHVPGTRYGVRFAFAGTNYGSFLARSNILACPSWSPSQPLPLSLENAVAVAQHEMRKVVPPDKEFYLKEITLNCVGQTLPQDAYSWWYFLIYFEPVHPSPGKIGLQERVGISVDFQGHPGFVEPYDER